ncbi:MAG: amidophosphoribosyltransferase, partial [Clostridiales bacterium]
MEELKEECGIVGIYTDDDSLDISGNLFYALYGLQHRGQESCGMAIYNEGKIKYCKELGLVSETFNDEILSGLQGNIGLGHVRYASSQNNTWVNSQPIVVNCLYGMMAVAYNGSLVNSLELGRELCQEGSIFISTCDAELVLQLVSRNMTQGHVVEDAISLTMDKIKGAYAFAMILQDKLIGFRDPNGIRPLCIGRMANAWLLASESCTFSIIGAEFVRDVEPGEIIVIDKDGLHSYKKGKADKTALCIFEFVYFARPDSYIDGSSVHAARLEGGRLLAREAPVDADLVIGAPDSALSAAMGYSRESGIPYGHGLIRNRYVGRTFIQPTQEMRENAVRIKF